MFLFSLANDYEHLKPVQSVCWHVEHERSRSAAPPLRVPAARQPPVRARRPRCRHPGDVPGKGRVGGQLHFIFFFNNFDDLAFF